MFPLSHSGDKIAHKQLANNEEGRMSLVGSVLKSVNTLVIILRATKRVEFTDTGVDFNSRDAKPVKTVETTPAVINHFSKGRVYDI